MEINPGRNKAASGGVKTGPVIPPKETKGRRPQSSGLICLLLALITLAVYWPVRNFNFINYDDPEYVTENPHVLHGLTLRDVEWAFGTDHASNWHPVTWLSHMLDVSLFGRGSHGPHLMNLLLHAANAVLLFLILCRLTGARWRSAMVAALFALHPLHVESVAWISERKDVLSTLFAFLAILAYLSYVEEQRAKSIKAGKFYGLTVLFFGLSLLSKPMLVTLPFVLLLLDYWPLERWNLSRMAEWPGTLGKLVWEKKALFGLSAISSLITYLVQEKSGAVHSFAETSLGNRLMNALVSYARYLEKTVWPVDLALPYPYREHWPAMELAVAGFVLLAMTAVVLWFCRRAPFALTGWLWYLGTLVPVIGLVQVGTQSMADRYSYVPLVGIFILVTWGAACLWERFRLPGMAAGVMAALVLCACAVATRAQLRYWRNTGTLFDHTLAVTKDNYAADDALGFYLFRTEHIDEAIPRYRDAMRINPRDSTAYDNMGFAQYTMGDVSGAITNYLRALQLNPRYPNCLNNLGSALMARNQYTNAMECYADALKLEPDYVDARNNLGVALFRTGRIDDAINEYWAVLQLMPEDAQANNNLANALVARGRIGEAVEHYQLAVKYDPSFLDPLVNLGYVLAAEGQFGDAIQCYERALSLKPGDAQLHCDFGSVLAKAGQRGQAAQEYKEALRLRPDLAEARQALNALGQTGRK